MEDVFVIDIDEVKEHCDAVFDQMYQIFLKEQTNITERDSQLLTVVSSLVKYLDNLVSET